MLLKKENFWIFLICNLLTCGLFSFVLAKKLNVYEQNAWYTNWAYWFLGIILGIFPALIMSVIFYIQICIGNCKKLNISLENIYGSPYFWIICIIIPIIGWTLFLTMLIYVSFAPAIGIKNLKN